MKSENANDLVSKKSQEELELPFWVEIGFTLPIILLIIIDMAVIGISFVAGARWFDIFVRTIVATISAGMILWLLSLNWSNGMLEGVVRASLDESKLSENEAVSTHVKEV